MTKTYGLRESSSGAPSHSSTRARLAKMRPGPQMRRAITSGSSREKMLTTSAADIHTTDQALRNNA